MFIIYDKNMNVKPFPKGVHPLDIYISSIPKNRETEEMEGRHGVLDKSFTYAPRPIEAEFMLISYDTMDYRLLRDEVYTYLTEDDYFYVSEIYQKGKRYKATVSESFIPERASQTSSSFSIPLKTVDLPFAESIGTTQNIQQNGISAEDELWGYGMGLIDDPDSLIYTHTANSFRIYNAGDVPIHPFEQSLRITITVPSTPPAVNYIELKNKTNGTVFRFEQRPLGNDKIILDGPNITKNGLNILRSTNKQFITLEPGWNEFEKNANVTVSFDFPFYYL